MAFTSISRSFMPDETLARIGAGISTAIDMQAALKHLLCSCDAGAEPRVLHAQFNALEACVDKAQQALSTAKAAMPDDSIVWATPYLGH